MASNSQLEGKLKRLYEESARQLNERCIIEEIKNNNTVALENYSTLIEKIDREVKSLKIKENLRRMSATEKLSAGMLQEVRKKAVDRRAALSKRVNNREIYRISPSKRSDFSSYSSFASAFKQPPEKYEIPSNQFKVPGVRPSSGPGSHKTLLTVSSSKNDTHINEVKVRKSLDLPRPRASADLPKNVRSKSPLVRKDRPKSVDLSINRAALLAWDQNQRKVSPPSRPTSPVSYQQISNNGKSHGLQPGSRRKYNYVQPTINTQISLTPVNTRRKVSHQRTASSHQPSTENKILVTTSSNTTSNERTTAPPKYKDPRISKMMDDLQGVDQSACEQILEEIMVTDENLRWDDIAGLDAAKRSLKETVVYPFLRPDLFKGLREPISGMLLFGPPGTGKTMIAKTVANEASSTFFSISASSLLSKFLGESEKLIRALFYIAKKLSPSIIFFDEVDSLLTARSDGENESSRRVKTEFLIQWSSLVSATSKDKDDIPRVLVLAATNLPWAIDEAARRRFSRRLYIPLPEFDTRLAQLKKLMGNSHHNLTETDFIVIANLTEGYSGSDITALAKEAAMEPIRDIGENLMSVENQEIRVVCLADFEKAMLTIKRSVGDEVLKRFEDWAHHFGSSGS